MKKKVAIILMIITVILLVITLSCKKEPLYQNGGVVDNPIDTTSKTKEPTLCETAWVLTYMQKGFSSEKPNDTIYFNYDYTFVVAGTGHFIILVGYTDGRSCLAPANTLCH